MQRGVPYANLARVASIGLVSCMSTACSERALPSSSTQASATASNVPAAPTAPLASAPAPVVSTTFSAAPLDIDAYLEDAKNRVKRGKYDASLVHDITRLCWNDPLHGCMGPGCWRPSHRRMAPRTVFPGSPEQCMTAFAMLEGIAQDRASTDDNVAAALFGLTHLATSPKLRARARALLQRFDDGSGTAMSRQARSSLRELRPDAL